MNGPSAPLRLGIIGPGEIAGVLAGAVLASGAARIERVYGRDPARTLAFAARYGGRAAASLAELLADSALEAVYVATPHPDHAEVVHRALDAGQSVLCEKPLTVSPIATDLLWRHAARSKGVLLEAWMYRAHPQIERVQRWILEGAIGRVTHIESSFCFEVPFDPKRRLFAPELGGGAILDVGGYPLSLAQLVAAAAMGDRTPHGAALAPRWMEAHGRLAPTGVDEFAIARLEFWPGLTAEIAVATRTARPRRAVITGEAGLIAMEDPFLPGGERLGRVANVELVRRGASEVHRIPAEADAFSLEVLELRRLVRGPRGPLGETLEPRPPMVGRTGSLAIAAGLEHWQRMIHRDH